MFYEDNLINYGYWHINIIFDKLTRNQFPSDYDLNHYLFPSSWRSIEEILQRNKIYNESIQKFYNYLLERFSVKQQDDLTIYL